MSGALRGTSAASMRIAECKDCQREIEGLVRSIEKAREDGDRALTKKLESQLSTKQASTFSYSEHSAGNVLSRGGSRSDRCTEHRKKHRTNIQGMAVAYVDLATLGEAVGAHDEGGQGPTGPFGGLGPLPGNHKVDKRTADLATYEFGMNDKDIVEILETLRNPKQRVLVLKAGTGTGKSTFGPFRLMDPPTMADLRRFDLVDEAGRFQTSDGQVLDLPASGPFRLTDLGPIIVTEPRVAAATGVGRFVGEKLAMGCVLKQCPHPEHGTFNPKAHVDDPGGIAGASCPDINPVDKDRACKRPHVGPHPWPKIKGKCVVTDCYSHVGPGFPVGYQVSGDRNHDDACQLVFVTDGTMINWLREGRLSRIGTVIVDEAHERSTNIDFIMGYLARDLAKYPHLRVIITSATFEPKFYEEFFETHAGKGIVAVKEVPAVKTVGYGMPLFPELDHSTPAMQAFISQDGRKWPEEATWPLVTAEDSDADDERFIKTYWPVLDKSGAPLLDSDGVPLRFAKAPKLKENEVVDPADAGDEEDLWETTRALLSLRYGQVDGENLIEPDKWRGDMPKALADYVIRLAQGLDEAGIFGDILGFLPTARVIEEARARIQSELGYADDDVCGLVSSLGDEAIEKALSARRKGDPRKIVISTNLAETSLTVEGVRFVVDSGLIAQSEWDAEMASGSVGTKQHSQSGIKQRWGRVGRKAPGWVFPMYSKQQFAELAEDTPPGSARENLEQLMMTARMGGIDDVKTFPWPAAFDPTQTQLDESAKKARKDFLAEMDRADTALRGNGAVDQDGHPTSFGKELVRFSGVGSPGSAMAIMYADRLGCVPEVSMILALLDDARLVGRGGLFPDSYDWPDEWRVEAASRHRALAALAQDDAHLVLLVAGAWERADPGVPPWEESFVRRAWARTWWVDNDVLLEAAKKRQAALAALSPAMKEEVKRFVEPSLLNRARGILVRTLGTFEFLRDGDSYVEANPVVSLDDFGNPRPPTAYGIERDALTSPAASSVLALRRRRAGVESAISNLVTVPAEPALRGVGTNAASSIADAIAMVLVFKEHAAPEPMRDVPLALMERFPIGLRVRMAPAGDGVPASDVRERKHPFARPPTPEEEEREGLRQRTQEKQAKRRRFRDPDEASRATREDAKGDLGLRYRTGEDDERREMRRVAAADRSVGEVADCGECQECLAGRRCTADVRATNRGFDALRDWKTELRERARDAVGNVRFKVDAGSGSEGPANPESDGTGSEAWYEVVGYTDLDSEAPAIQVVKDWRAEGAQADPSKHHEVHAGMPIQVRVAGWVKDHQDRLRVFERVDGQGRFLMREAPPGFKTQVDRNQIAVSLSSGAQGLLALLESGPEMTATVVPARAQDCFTITLLETLHQHLEQARGGLTQVLVDPRDPKKGRESAYPAVVSALPNDNGYMAFRLLFGDSERGFQHLISYKPPAPRGNEDPDESEQGVGTFTVDPPQPWLLRLVRDEPELSVGGLNLDEIESIVKDSARQLRIPRSHDKDSQEDETLVIGTDFVDEVNSEADGAKDFRKAPRKARLKSTGKNPLSRPIAKRLADLDDTPEWRNTVWAFWARTHHRLLRGDGAVTPGTSTEPVELRLARQQATVATPREIAQRNLAELRKTADVDSVVTGVVVDHIGTAGVLVTMEETDVAIFVPLSEVSWVWLDDPRDGVQVGQRVHVKILELDDDKGEIVGSIKQLIPEPYVQFCEAYDPGEIVMATVREVETDLARLDLPQGVKGFLPGAEVDWVRVPDVSQVLTIGDQIQVRIKEFDDDRRNVVVSLRAVEPDPLLVFKDAHPPGGRVSGVITIVETGYARLELAHGVEGFLPGGEVRHERVDDLGSVLSVGQSVTVEVLRYEIDGRTRNVRVSIKQTLPSPLESFKSNQVINQTLSGTVIRFNPMSAVIDLGGPVKGNVHLRDVTGHFLESFHGRLEIGRRYDFRIIGYDEKFQQVKLAAWGVAPTAPAPVVRSAPPLAPPVAPVARAEPDVRPPVQTPPPRVTPVRTPPPRMPKSIIQEGDSLQDAEAAALRALGLSRAKAVFETLDEGKRGFLGGVKRRAKVRVTERL